MRLCKDCVHMIAGVVPQCGASSRISPVTGERKTYDCGIERAFDVPGGCGPLAHKFEAREARTRKCPSCGGSGREAFRHENCLTCGGTGKIEAGETMEAQS